jgi:hypothetical protein
LKHYRVVFNRSRRSLLFVGPQLLEDVAPAPRAVEIETAMCREILEKR